MKPHKPTALEVLLAAIAVVALAALLALAWIGSPR